MQPSQLSSGPQQTQAGSMAEKIRSKAEKLKNNDKTFSVEKQGEKMKKSGSDESGPTTEKNPKLMKAANKVEGFFISFMMKKMRDTVKHTEGLFKRGQAEKMFQSRLDNKYADKIAKSKNFGLAQTVYNQFSSTATQ